MKKNLFIFIVVVIAVFVFQHRSTPNIPTPVKYTQVGANIQIPAHMTVNQGGQEFWNLTRRSTGSYFVNVYNNYKLIRSFPANKLLSKDATGSNYTTGGTVMFDRSLYTAIRIHIDKSGTSGYILFSPAHQTTTSQG